MSIKPSRGPPHTININYTLPDRCEAETKYTFQVGETCDTIAERYSVSRATLYYLNPDVANCTAPSAGFELCHPDQCERTYTVQSKDDSCVDVAVIHGTSWKNIVDWNADIDSRCSNIWNIIPFWGRVLCVSSPRGEFVPPPPSKNTTPGNGNVGGPGGFGDGYSNDAVPPPRAALWLRGLRTAVESMSKPRTARAAIPYFPGTR